MLICSDVNMFRCLYVLDLQMLRFSYITLFRYRDVEVRKSFSVGNYCIRNFEWNILSYRHLLKHTQTSNIYFFIDIYAPNIVLHMVHVEFNIIDDHPLSIFYETQVKK